MNPNLSQPIGNMLRTLAVGNFVEFRETQILKFQEGPHFLVGPNSTGKTALFELTRRCLSTKSNPKVSYIPDESKPAYVICKFELNPELVKTISEEVESSPTPCKDGIPQKNKSLYSCCFVNKDHSNGKQLFKLVCVYDTPMRDGNIRIYIQRFPFKGNLIKTTECNFEWISSFSTNHELAEEFMKFDKLIKDDDSPGVAKAVNIFIGLLNRLPDPTSSAERKENTFVGKILQQLEKVVVVTFPVRGHGPLQWNQNPEMGNLDGGYRKYKNVSDAAVILQDLLDSPDVCHDEAEKTFSELIIPYHFVFKKVKRENSNEQGYDIMVEKNGHAIPLMKIPEGILEARHFSLILAHTKYQTICLEEPGRGMHPPMVQRMRDLLLRKQKGKTLIIVSHKPSMINFWAFDRMFVSRNNIRDNTPHHSIRRVSSTMLRRYQEENFKQMLFSSSVLFIEGQTDRVVLGSLFHEILETDLNFVDSVQKDKIQQIQRLVAETNLIEIGGSTGYNPYKGLSNDISVQHWFLFDKDSVFTSNPEVQLREGKKTEARIKVLTACVALIDEKESDMNALLELDVKETVTQTGKSKGKKQKMDTVSRKVKDCLSLRPNEIPDNIRTILKIMYLPKKEDVYHAKDKNTSDTFNLGEDDPNRIETYSKDDRRIFIWQTGNIEDVIVKSIVDMEDDTKMMDMLRDIVTCKTARKGKELMKEALMEMDKNTAKVLARHLLKCDEIKRFFTFMLPSSDLSYWNEKSH